MSAPEDIFNDSLSFLGEEVVQESETICYGPVRVAAAPKAGAPPPISVLTLPIYRKARSVVPLQSGPKFH